MSRKCEFCGCLTNAHLRKCCAKGYLADGGKEENMKFDHGNVLLDNRKGNAWVFLLVSLLVLFVAIAIAWSVVGESNKYNYQGDNFQRLDRIETLLNKHTEIYNSLVNAPKYTLCPVCARRNTEQ